MIRLDLDLPAWTLLHDLLTEHLATSPTAEDPASNELAQALCQNLLAAHATATSTQTCPVCRQTFTQLKNGRLGHYCSPACRQKAYRQRRLAFQRSVLGRRP